MAVHPLGGTDKRHDTGGRGHRTSEQRARGVDLQLADQSDRDQIKGLAAAGLLKSLLNELLLMHAESKVGNI